MEIIISGIQQMGIGVPNVYDAWRWYRNHIGMDIPLFDEAAEANLMLPYTGGQPQERHAILALNLQGGSGMEIWQYLSRAPQAPSFTPSLGDLGIFICKIKSRNVQQALTFLSDKQVELVSSLVKDPINRERLYLKDPFGNLFEIEPGHEWFQKGKYTTGGVSGAMIGVAEMERSKDFYGEMLGYDQVIFDEKGVFEDFLPLPGGKEKYHRVLLTHSQARKGAFSKMLGPSRMELIQALDRKPKKIFDNRFWGDLGFIHLCFDIQGMDILKEKCASRGYPFVVDSANSFDMGEAAGRFSYIEDPDGTLIEFVETHKIPIIKTLGWYLNLQKRDPQKTLPSWMLKSLAFNRVKD